MQYGKAVAYIMHSHSGGVEQIIHKQVTKQAQENIMVDISDFFLEND